MTPAEGAAEAYVRRFEASVDRILSDTARPEYEAAFVAGWEARPVLTREQIRSILRDTVGEYADEDYGTYDQQADNLTEALLAQGDVPSRESASTGGSDE